MPVKMEEDLLMLMDHYNCMIYMCVFFNNSRLTTGEDLGSGKEMEEEITMINSFRR